MNLAYYTHPIDKLHQENVQFLKSRRFCDRNNMPFSWQIEQEVRRRIEAYGYTASFTPHSHPFDLAVRDGFKMIPIEVKGSTCSHVATKRSYRYQANIRNRAAEILIFVCFDDDEQFHFFFIPKAVLGRRRNIAIWSPDPRHYAGQWAPYLDAWHHLDRALALAPPMIAQPALFPGKYLS